MELRRLHANSAFSTSSSETSASLPDFLKARELCEEARRGGVAQAAFILGVFCEQQGDLKARELYEETHR